MAQRLLHGVIDAKIMEADLAITSGGLIRPTKKTMMKRKVFSWIKKLPFCSNCQYLENAIGLGPTAGKLSATVDLDKARVGRTRMLDPGRSPKWNEFFHIYCAHDASHVIFTVKTDNPVGATLIGRAYLPVGEDIINGKPIEQWLRICDDNRQPLDSGDMIHVQLRFTDVGSDPTGRWDAGVGAAYPGVPRTFFGQRRGCRVRLYQDAHIADGFAPRVRLAGGRPYEPRRCWADVFDAISNARRLVYVAGWSINTGVALVRDPRRPSSGTTLGELLKQKAREGVTVLMLVWDDRTSTGLRPIKRDGLMATHDEDTASYFRGSSVRCVLCPRNPDRGRSYVQDLEMATMFTHHQKTVVVDGGVADVNAAPRLVAFVGGIDLCDGRYDTQEHPLFRTLGTTHRRDFHQPNFPGASIEKGGPREPWHDIHCRVEGPAAWDVLENFEQRWRKQGDGDNFLVALNKAWAPREAVAENDPESWNVQVFRSIDGGAAHGFPDPENPDEAAARGLVSGKDHVIERSIQDAYIHAIRRARDFIYIENQYFLGSSYGWRRDDGVTVEAIDALHLIPKELSLKIASKIKAGERFAVYVVVPMWPEGVPESGSVQAILDWQRRTMEMMYRDVALAIQAEGVQGADPRDYLTFFCLGNREAPTPGEYTPTQRPDPDTDYQRAQEARRFMIYVHAKMMIVDDEYIIAGSANINQRSMDGGRDSEIAMGAYQPGYLATPTRPARGQVHGFRVALWQEHLGRAAAAEADAAGDLLQPSSLACVRRMNRVAQQHWDLYAAATLRGDLPGHLMAYPVGVGGDGMLLETTTNFPDTKARVLGNKSDILPSILTT